MILVALGANLPDQTGRTALETCRWAADRLAQLPDLRLMSRSRWYRTAPVPRSDQPDYVNGVVRLSGAAEPHALLARLHAIEAEAGRVRGAANAARTLDLDLLAIGGLVVNNRGLVLPHPRVAERAFVLRPLCDVAPDWRHPLLHETAETLLSHVEVAGVVPL
jgi:2-amino-4-hydroxy-6-hydroxymethyldihydropteridine diphosphokinase